MCDRCDSKRHRTLTLAALLPMLIATPPDISSFVGTPGNGKMDRWAAVSSSAAGAFAAEAKTADADAPIKYTCPMHPHYIADEMGTCPICGMDLVKLETGDGDLSAANGEARTAITVSSETIQNIGVRLGKAEQSTFGRTIRSYGIVHENERRQFELTSRVEGWIDELNVTAVGDEVKKGQLLFRLYSPQLIISQGDYMRSRNNRATLKRAEGQLRAFGVQPQALRTIRKKKQPLDLVPFYAQQDGTVSELMLRQGTYVKRGMMLLRVQDYSNVWLRVGVAEKDLTFLSKNTPAMVSFPNLPGRQVAARVDYIYPTIDPKTRTGQVRLVIDNKDGAIRPGSYADVEFDVGAEKRLAVPSESILRSGQGRYIVASLGQGRFEPRLVEIGLVSDGRTEIKRGILDGEDVVVSGQFMLDSESALRESFRKLQKLQVPLSLLKLTNNEFAMVDHLIDAALYVHEAIVDGYDVEPKQLDPAISIKDFLWPRYKETQLAFVLSDATNALKKVQTAKTESELQTALAVLVGHLRAWVLKGAPDHYKEKNLVVFEDKTRSRTWFQVGGKPINPYARGGGELVPYPVSADPASEDKVVQNATVEPTASQHREQPRGSHSGTRGSHNVE